MKQIFTLLACLLTFAFAKAQSTSSFHSLSAVLLDGNPVNMSQYYGKKLMVVNVASFCAYTLSLKSWKHFMSNTEATISRSLVSPAMTTEGRAALIVI